MFSPGALRARSKLFQSFSNIHPIFPTFASYHHLQNSQEEIIKGTDPESFGEEVAAAKRTQENLNRSMRMNDGQL